MMGRGMKHLLRKVRLIRQISIQTKQIRELLHTTLEQADVPHTHFHQNLFPPMFRLLDLFQQFLSPDGKVPEVSNYEEQPPDQVDLSLPQLLVVFRRTLQTLQQQPSETLQHSALEILHSYFIELQGLYDLVFVRRFVNETPELPFSLSALEDEHKRYFRCFQLTEQALSKLKQDGLSDDALRKLRTLQLDQSMTEEQLSKALVDTFGQTQSEQYQFLIMKHAQVLQHITSDPLIREYQSIPFSDLMSVSAFHHIRIVLLRLLPKLIVTAFKETIQGKPRCQGIKNPDAITTVDALRQFFQQHPLTETAKFGIAFHRHLMRVADLVCTRMILKWGRPVFELLILGTWLQTVKDHIIPGTHRPSWQAEHLDLSQDATQEVVDPDARTGSVRLSSAFFMQPRVKFGLERFLIFKLRTMTVGDIVRVTEFGNWMRKNSPDEFLQFFNIALGDMGGLGIRTMPEHEIIEDEHTLLLYSALMTFIPGGATSPGSNEMRKHNYSLTKKQQLFHELRFYDPRFKRSSNFINDVRAALGSVLVMDKGRVGKALQETESFDGKKRGF
jgi:hypothetical protein